MKLSLLKLVPSTNITQLLTSGIVMGLQHRHERSHMFRIHTVLHQMFTRNENRLRTTLLSPLDSRQMLLSSFFFVGNALLAGGCMSNSSSRSRGLASGALWQHGGEALVSGRNGLHAVGYSMQTLGNSYYTWQHICKSICFLFVRWFGACGWYLSLCQLFRCGSVFDFSISQLTGWQFKITG